MAYEIESQSRARLEKLYAEMSDGELLELESKPEELTDIAQDTLASELKRRDLRPNWEANSGSSEQDRTSDVGPGVAGVFPGGGPQVEAPEELSEGLAEDEISLNTFHDAFEVGRACETLEQAGLAFRLADVSTNWREDGVESRAFHLIVLKKDRDRAMSLLRQKMGLFPLQEVSEPDDAIDDGTVTQVGSFGREEDAKEIANVLQEAGIWNRVTANPEGTAENEDAWLVEVREVDLMQAGEAVEKAFGS